MKVGDYVHNVPHGKCGIIIEHRVGTDVFGDGNPPEEIFMVVWDDGSVHVAGSGFLQLKVEAA